MFEHLPFLLAALVGADELAARTFALTKFFLGKFLLEFMAFILVEAGETIIDGTESEVGSNCVLLSCCLVRGRLFLRV